MSKSGSCLALWEGARQAAIKVGRRWSMWVPDGTVRDGHQLWAVRFGPLARQTN